MTDRLSAPVTAALVAGGLDPAYVVGLARQALAEDLMGGVDVTSVATVPFDLEGTADVVARSAGVVAGVPVAAAVLQLAGDDDIEVRRLLPDATWVEAGESVLTVRGLVRTLLTGERTALNLICHLSGIATLTRRWVDVVEGTGATVLDTRKTTPGLRQLEKYAVRCGGGANKRMGLSDAALVKDNHVIAAGSVAAAYEAVRATFPDVEVQVECDTLEEVDQALAAGAEFLLLDNMGPELLRAAVARVAGRAQTEATGGLTLGRAREVAETGVDFLSAGELTHSAPVLDLGFDLQMGD